MELNNIKYLNCSQRLLNGLARIFHDIVGIDVTDISVGGIVYIFLRYRAMPKKLPIFDTLLENVDSIK